MEGNYLNNEEDNFIMINDHLSNRYSLVLKQIFTLCLKNCFNRTISALNTWKLRLRSCRNQHHPLLSINQKFWIFLNPCSFWTTSDSFKWTNGIRFSSLTWTRTSLNYLKISCCHMQRHQLESIIWCTQLYFYFCFSGIPASSRFHPFIPQICIRCFFSSSSNLSNALVFRYL